MGTQSAVRTLASGSALHSKKSFCEAPHQFVLALVVVLQVHLSFLLLSAHVYASYRCATLLAAALEAVRPTGVADGEACRDRDHHEVATVLDEVQTTSNLGSDLSSTCSFI